MPEFQTDNALVLASRLLGENTYMLSLFTQEKGKHLGVIKKKTPPDIASFVDSRWQARLIDQTGNYYIDAVKPFSSAFLDDRKRLACLSCLCFLLDKLLPERQPNAFLYDATLVFLKHLNDDDFISKYLFWEMDLLASIGFGLDFSQCAGGGDKNNLAYVSPKTGRAVSLEKGAPYKDKLLKLPAFLWKNDTPTPQDLKSGFLLTGYFLSQKAGINPLPDLRETILS